jgi:hypothetical protein
MSENVEDSTSRNPKGLHGLYRDKFTFTSTFNLEWTQTRRIFRDVAFELCIKALHYKGPRKPGVIGNEWDTPSFGIY